jgi:transcriptional regulator with XRE-family HTH domain
MAAEAGRTRSGSVIPNGELIRKLRTEKGWDIDTFSDRSGWKPRTLQAVEAGESCRIHTLSIIAKTLGVTPKEIMRPDTPENDATIQQQKELCNQPNVVSVTIKCPLADLITFEPEAISQFAIMLSNLLPSKGVIFIISVIPENSITIILGMLADDSILLEKRFSEIKKEARDLFIKRAQAIGTLREIDNKLLGVDLFTSGVINDLKDQSLILLTQMTWWGEQRSSIEQFISTIID